MFHVSLHNSVETLGTKELCKINISYGNQGGKNFWIYDNSEIEFTVRIVTEERLLLELHGFVCSTVKFG